MVASDGVYRAFYFFLSSAKLPDRLHQSYHWNAGAKDLILDDFWLSYPDNYVRYHPGELTGCEKKECLRRSAHYLWERDSRVKGGSNIEATSIRRATEAGKPQGD